MTVARAKLMDTAGNQLLADAGLAEDENGGIGGRDDRGCVDHAVPDDAVPQESPVISKVLGTFLKRRELRLRELHISFNGRTTRVVWRKAITGNFGRQSHCGLHPRDPDLE